MYRKGIKNANGLIVAEETKSRFSRLNMYIFQTDNIVQILTSCLLYWVQLRKFRNLEADLLVVDIELSIP